MIAFPKRAEQTALDSANPTNVFGAFSCMVTPATLLLLLFAETRSSSSFQPILFLFKKYKNLTGTIIFDR